MLPAEFWAGERKTLLSILLPRLEQIAFAAQQHAAAKMEVTFNPTLSNKDAEDWARAYTDTVLEELQTFKESKVGDILGDWISTPGSTYGDLVASLKQSHALDSVRASRIAQTEITRAYAQGEALAYERELGITAAVLPVEDSHIGCRCWLAVKRAGNHNVIVWQTNRDDTVCRKAIETPWGMVNGCKELDGVIVSDGAYLGRKYDSVNKMAKIAGHDSAPYARLYGRAGGYAVWIVDGDYIRLRRKVGNEKQEE